MTVADFSQKNDAVEIAAPGVNVQSTVPFASEASVAVGANVYEALGMDGSPEGVASGPLVDGGLCTAPGAWTGVVVLCERGEIAFAEKVAAAEAGGGVAAVIYNNEPGLFAGTLGDSPTSTIPSVSVSQEDGQLMLASSLGEIATVAVETVENTYAYYSGTSMSAPHVSGAAAVLLSSDRSLRGVDVREAMTATALDLGAPGKDVEYGYGLVQMYDAWQYLGGMPNDVRPPLKMPGR